MSMTDEDRSNLVRLELEKAHDTFEEIEILRQAGWKEDVHFDSYVEDYDW